MLCSRWRSGKGRYSSTRKPAAFSHQPWRRKADNVTEPEEEVIKLFGRNIALHYFVVRLSLRNTDAEDRLVSSGMMRARGRAIVESPTKSGAPLRFTVPVEVAPHSAQQIYSILSDESVNEPRAVVFRAFELAGAVASAYALSFGADILTKDAIQLSTGIGVPAFSKFWTDRLPGYQRNIVNFAMDDLVKIPKGGVTSHKFLFFPKDKIEGMIIDQHSYAERTFTAPDDFVWVSWRDFDRPAARAGARSPPPGSFIRRAGRW